VGNELHSETVSNEFLPPDGKLSPEEERKLAELGWQPPKPKATFNYWYRLSLPASTADQDAFVRRLIDTLRDVHGIDDPAALSVEGWNDETRQPIPFHTSPLSM
jgi:hypothetical protein